MPAIPALLLYSAHPVTRVGPEAEDFLLVEEVTFRAEVEKELHKDYQGRIFEIEVGNTFAQWSIEAMVLSQRGAGDSHPGSILSSGALNNLSGRQRFGIDASDGMLFFMGGTSTDEPGELTRVNLEIHQHFIQNDAGSPDGPSTDSIVTYPSGGASGGSNVQSPRFTGDSEFSGTEDVAFSETLSASGAIPITFAIESGNALPAGLSLNGATGEITGTPTDSGIYQTNVRASNAYGSAVVNVKITVAEPAAPADDPIVVYVRTYNDLTTPPDTFTMQNWKESDLSDPDIDYATFLSEEGVSEGIVTDGTGDHDVYEIYNVRLGIYWYQQSTADVAIRTALASGQDPMTVCAGTITGAGGTPPTPPTPPTTEDWPGARAYNEQITQYWIYENPLTGRLYSGARDAANAYVDLSDFLSGNPTIGTEWSATKPFRLRELADVSGGSASYLFQYFVGPPDNRIQTALTAGESPFYEVAGVRPLTLIYTPFNETAPAFAELPLPAAPSPLLSGTPPLSGLYDVYVLKRAYSTGRRSIFSYGGAYVAGHDTLQEILNDGITDLSYNEVNRPWRLEELWFWNGSDWVCRWLNDGLTEDDSRIGLCLASGIEPGNHPTCGPGLGLA